MPLSVAPTPKIESSLYHIISLNMHELEKQYSITRKKIDDRDVYFVSLSDMIEADRYVDAGLLQLKDRHLSVDRLYASEHSRLGQQGLSIAHYTENWENQEYTLVAHVYFGESGSVLYHQVKIYDKETNASKDITDTLTETQLQTLMTRNQDGQKVFSCLIDYRTTEASQLIREIEKANTLIARKFNSLKKDKSDENFNQYIESCQIYIDLIAQLNSLSDGKYDSRGDFIKKQIGIMKRRRQQVSLKSTTPKIHDERPAAKQKKQALATTGTPPSHSSINQDPEYDMNDPEVMQCLSVANKIQTIKDSGKVNTIKEQIELRQLLDTFNYSYQVIEACDIAHPQEYKILFEMANTLNQNQPSLQELFIKLIQDKNYSDAIEVSQEIPTATIDTYFEISKALLDIDLEKEPLMQLIKICEILHVKDSNYKLTLMFMTSQYIPFHECIISRLALASEQNPELLDMLLSQKVINCEHDAVIFQDSSTLAMLPFFLAKGSEDTASLLLKHGAQIFFPTKTARVSFSQQEQHEQKSSPRRRRGNRKKQSNGLPSHGSSLQVMEKISKKHKETERFTSALKKLTSARNHAIEYLSSPHIDIRNFLDIIQKTPLQTLLKFLAKISNQKGIRGLRPISKQISNRILATEYNPNDSVHELVRPNPGGHLGLSCIYYPAEEDAACIQTCKLISAIIPYLEEQLNNISRTEIEELSEELIKKAFQHFQSKEYGKAHDTYNASVLLSILTNNFEGFRNKERLLQTFSRMALCELKLGVQTNSIGIICNIMTECYSPEEKLFLIEKSKLFEWFLKKFKMTTEDALGSTESSLRALSSPKKIEEKCELTEQSNQRILTQFKQAREPESHQHSHKPASSGDCEQSVSSYVCNI